MNFCVPTTKERSELANLRAAAYAHQPKYGETKSTMPCPCGGKIRFTIQSSGLSWGQCTAACGRRWVT